MTISGTVICSREQESIEHLFTRYEFRRWVLEQAMETAGALVKLGAVTNFEEMAVELNKVIPGSPVWGLQWNVYGVVLFHIWKQRNQRRIQAKKDTKQEVLRKSIEMTNIIFNRERYKRKCRTREERQTLHQWDALLMLIHDKDGGS